MNKKIAYAIPNLFTAGSLICALIALNQIVDGYFIQAAWLVTLSLILDGFDGRMARMLNATSRIGAQADSLADFVAFGIVPGFLAWQMSLKYFGFLGFIVFVIYVLCGGFRLARFNVVNISITNKNDFMGLPIPAAAAAICSFILFKMLVLSQHSSYASINESLHFLLLLVIISMSYLMVSKIPYIAVNKQQKKKKYISLILIFVTILAVAIIGYTVWVYFVCVWLYIFYGIFNKTMMSIYKYQEKHLYKKNIIPFVPNKRKRKVDKL